MTTKLIIAGARFRHRAAEVKAARDEKIFNDLYARLAGQFDEKKLESELKKMVAEKQNLLNLSVYRRA